MTYRASEPLSPMFLIAKRTRLYDTHGKMDNLMLRALQKTDDLAYLEKYQEFCKQQADDIRAYIEAYRNMKEAEKE